MIVRLDLKIPLFSVRIPEALGVLLSYTLPPPKTVVSLLTRGIGYILDVNPELRVHNAPCRVVLTWVTETSCYVTVKPLSPIIKSYQMWRVRWLERKLRIDKKLVPEQLAQDAVEYNINSTSELSFYYFIDIENLNKKLEKALGLRVTSYDIIKSFWVTERVGATEFLTSLKGVRELEVKTLNSVGEIDTYAPSKWLEPRGPHVIEKMPSILLLSKPDISLDEFIREYQRRKSTEAYESYTLPLWSEVTERKVMYKPGKVKVTARNGFSICLLSDYSSSILPNNLVKVLKNE